MDYEEFVEEAHRMWEEVPASYREGIDGMVVKREAETHPEHDDYYTMGMCFTEPYPSGYGGPDSTRSILALYYGSFAEIAKSDPDFSWEDELWETITHELRHHLEFMVEDDALEGVDHAMEQSHRRSEGVDFDPWYFQSGIEIAPGVYRAEDEVYIEQRWSVKAFAQVEALSFEWAGERWSVPKPPHLGDIHYIWVLGLPSEEHVQLVLARDLSFWDRIRRWAKRIPLELLESEVEASRLGAVADSSRAPELEPPGHGSRPDHESRNDRNAEGRGGVP